jgi:hypothetical protein
LVCHYYCPATKYIVFRALSTRLFDAANRLILKRQTDICKPTTWVINLASGVLQQRFEASLSASRLLKKPLAALCGVGNGLKMLMYNPVHCAFSPISALPGIHQRVFQQPTRAADHEPG